MPLYEPIVPARYAAVLVDTVRALDEASIQPTLASAGLCEDFFQNPSAVLGISQFDRLICAAVEQLGREDLGFEYGLRLGIDHHSVLGQAMRRCLTGHELLSMMGRYWRLTTTSFFIQYRRKSTAGEVIFRPIAPMTPLTLHVMEEMFAVSFHTDYMAMTGNRPGLVVHLSQPRPAHFARYRDLLPTQFRFSSDALPQARCVLTPKLLDAELTHPVTTSKTLPGAASLADDTPARTRQCAALVQLILEEAEGVQPDVHAVAEWLNLSSRTLIRYLSAEGQSLRTMGSTIRHKRACHMLRQSSQPIGQIAQRLGYSSVIAFSNAFKRQAGVSPRTFRTGALP